MQTASILSGWLSHQEKVTLPPATSTVVLRMRFIIRKSQIDLSLHFKIVYPRHPTLLCRLFSPPPKCHESKGELSAPASGSLLTHGLNSYRSRCGYKETFFYKKDITGVLGPYVYKREERTADWTWPYVKICTCTNSPRPGPREPCEKAQDCRSSPSLTFMCAPPPPPHPPVIAFTFALS